MKIILPKFYRVVLVTALLVTGYLAYYAYTCNNMFCSVVVIFIPPLWVIATVACVSYFISSKIGKSAEKATIIAIVITVIFCILAYSGLLIWDYFQNKPFRDEVAAEQLKCVDQMKEFYNRYKIENFSEDLHRDKLGKIDNLVLGFNITSQGYSGTVKVSAEALAMGLDTKGNGLESVEIKNGIKTPVRLEIPIYTTMSQSDYLKPDSDKFSIRLTDSDTQTKDVDWYFTWWWPVNGSVCAYTIGGPNTLAHVLPELVVQHP